MLFHLVFTVFTLKHGIIQVVHLIDWTTLPVSHIETPVFIELPIQRIKEPHKLSLLAGQFTVMV